MKKLLILLVLVLVGYVAAGCTMTETAAQRRRRISQITDLQLRMLVEDWDYLWLYERNSGATPWHTWVGI